MVDLHFISMIKYSLEKGVRTEKPQPKMKPATEPENLFYFVHILNINHVQSFDHVSATVEFDTRLEIDTNDSNYRQISRDLNIVT